MPTYALDACAIIALNRMEDGWREVQDLLRKAKRRRVRLVMNIVNLVEVLYDRMEKSPPGKADEIFRHTYAMPITIIDKIDRDMARDIVRFKTGSRMSLADAILLATAKSTGATVVTADWGDLEKAADDKVAPFLWIRPRPQPQAQG